MLNLVAQQFLVGPTWRHFCVHHWFSGTDITKQDIIFLPESTDCRRKHGCFEKAISVMSMALYQFFIQNSVKCPDALLEVDIHVRIFQHTIFMLEQIKLSRLLTSHKGLFDKEQDVCWFQSSLFCSCFLSLSREWSFIKIHGLTTFIAYRFRLKRETFNKICCVDTYILLYIKYVWDLLYVPITTVFKDCRDKTNKVHGQGSCNPIFTLRSLCSTAAQTLQ